MNFLQGRTNRAAYWISVLFVGGLMTAARYLWPEHSSLHEVVLAVVCVPRLHDIGRSGWWLAAVLVPLELVGVAAVFTQPAETAQLIGGLTTLVLLGFLFVLGVIPGQKASNRFGDPPAGGLFKRNADAV